MKVAFVSNSYGNLALLETVLMMLVERHEVDRIVPVGLAARDVDAVLFARKRRFPEEVQWTEAGYDDYVLSAVLEGAVETPAIEVERTEMLELTVRRFDVAEGSLDFAGRKVGVQIDDAPTPDTPIVVASMAEVHQVKRIGGQLIICPGQLRDVAVDDEPACCALIAIAEGQLLLGFLDMYGDLVEEAVALD